MPITPAAPTETGPIVVAPPAAAPVAVALDTAVWLLNAAPLPELAAADIVAVDPPVAVETAAFELVAVATPAASRTANARILFFMIFRLTY
ncbi:hypothetical protein Pnap_0157 [Polaromonas naphthalenivorans CJ2]|uniref:Uncharacterized protein n=1 Tax=Polaromonas naphthalenivorans (strain CJ2) TaxID=365044 RepID=A1VIK4_POLNA|nr:hypothetical protein Pnap_0157 [Polaromonas naphthalenivorans CJ2]